MADIYLDNFPSFDLREIFNPGVFDDIKYQSFYFIECIDRDGAARYAGMLEKALQEVSVQTEEQGLMNEILIFWMLRLKLFGFESLSDQEKTDLFKKYIIDILKNELDLKGAIFRYIDIFESGSVVTQQTKDFITSLSGCQVALGSNEDTFKKVNFVPTISRWLKQYQQSINKRGMNLKPAAFDLVNFVDNDPYVKYLNPDELEILKRLLELYNWLLNPIIYVDKKSPEEPRGSYINSQKFELPEDVFQEPQSQPKPVPPVAPRPAVVQDRGAGGAGGAEGQIFNLFRRRRIRLRRKSFIFNRGTGGGEFAG